MAGSGELRRAARLTWTMSLTANMPAPAHPAIWERAVGSRDARFDGIFFVGITTTRVYCRPVCPARVSCPAHRRFFDSAALAEGAGFRPCLRCRPELAPGRATVDAVPRLARVAALRIEAGALNGRGVAALAGDLGVSERHLRRALERELGVSALELAQTHRLLFAKRLLADTTLSVTRIAFASGFQSLRRFNAAFREQYGLSPSAVRRVVPARAAARTTLRARGRAEAELTPSEDLVRLTLAYRPPFAWKSLMVALSSDLLPGAETMDGGRYGRVVRIDGRTGVVFATDGYREGGGRAAHHQLNIDLSASLVPALMPLLARLRHLFDLDAEPAVIDGQLRQNGLARWVALRPGLRIPGAIDGFEVALRRLARPAILALGEPVATGFAGLTRVLPVAAEVADAGVGRLMALGVAPRAAAALTAIASAVSSGSIRLEPGSDAAETRRALMELDGVDDRLATALITQALHWPDAFADDDARLEQCAGAAGPADLQALAESWRPWRAYAAAHLRLG